MNLYPPSGSRKLTGLYVTIGALLFTLLVGAVFWAIWGVPTELFASIGGFILGAGTSHQAAQSMADRSPNYPSGLPTYAAPAYTPPPPASSAPSPDMRTP